MEIDSRVLDAAIGGVGVLVALAAVLLQWRHFKRSHPVSKQQDGTNAPFGVQSQRNRWRTVYWREVRATLALAFISFGMVAFIVIARNELNVPTIASIMFWMGMFFYNLWVAQWYAWRIDTKRRR